MNRIELDPPIAPAGDIVTLSGVPDSMKVGDTLTLKTVNVIKPFYSYFPSSYVFFNSDLLLYI